MRYLGSDALREALPPSVARQAIAGAFAAIEAGSLSGPVRTSFGVAEGSSLLMPAVSREHLGLKVLHLRGDNPDRGLPAIVGEFFLYERTSGELLAVLDGVELTGIRTGALAGHATALLAPDGSRIGAVLGAGQQGYYQARALCEAAPLQELRIWNRTPQRAERLAERLRGELQGVTIRIAEDPAAAVAGAHAATLATAALRPLLSCDDVPAEIHLNAMGSYLPEMSELAPDLLAAASQLLVDDVAGALAEAGDLLQAAAAGKVSLGGLKTLAGARLPRRGITVFKSVGAAVFDLAVAEAVLRQ